MRPECRFCANFAKFLGGLGRDFVVGRINGFWGEEIGSFVWFLKKNFARPQRAV